jgi:hypothetical protein
VFLLVSLHAAFAGTDRTAWLYQVTAVASIVAVAWATVYRLTHRRPPSGARRGQATSAPARPLLPPPVASAVSAPTSRPTPTHPEF